MVMSHLHREFTSGDRGPHWSVREPLRAACMSQTGRSPGRSAVAVRRDLHGKRRDVIRPRFANVA